MTLSSPLPPSQAKEFPGLRIGTRFRRSLQTGRHLLEMIRFSHTLFALPFALVSLLVAVPGMPSMRVFFLIVLAVISARSAAMTFNRIVDLRFDRLNPRTQSRHLVQGQLSLPLAWLFLIFNVLVFFLTARAFNPLTGSLAFPALLVIFFYSFTKRFTVSSHLFIGLSLALAPLGAWIAVRGTLDRAPLYLALAVLFWVSGFDIIYATLDEAFDRKVGLKSVPALFGRQRALWLSRLCHALVPPFLFLFVRQFPFLKIYAPATVLLIAALLIYEHLLVKPGKVATDELERVNAAFFRVNGMISLSLLLSVSLDLWRGGFL